MFRFLKIFCDGLRAFVSFAATLVGKLLTSLVQTDQYVGGSGLSESSLLSAFTDNSCDLSSCLIVSVFMVKLGSKSGSCLHLISLPACVPQKPEAKMVQNKYPDGSIAMNMNANFDAVSRSLNLEVNDIVTLARNSVRAAFVPDDQKIVMFENIESAHRRA